MQSTKQVIFNLGEEEYGLDIMSVNTIEKYAEVEEVAEAPDYVKGVLRLRNEVVPVYNLRRKLGYEGREPDEETKLLVTSSNGMSIAYEVDQMQEIISLRNDQMYKTPSIVENKNTTYIKNVANENGRLFVMLNRDGILSEEEQVQMKKFIECC